MCSGGLCTGYVVMLSCIFIYATLKSLTGLPTEHQHHWKKINVSFCTNLIILIKCTSHIKKCCFDYIANSYFRMLKPKFLTFFIPVSFLTPWRQTPSTPPSMLAVLCLWWLECDLRGCFNMTLKPQATSQTRDTISSELKRAEPARRWGAILPHTSLISTGKWCHGPQRCLKRCAFMRGQML